MTRIRLPSDETIPSESRASIDAIENRIGMVPNLARLMSLSPPVINGIFALQTSLSMTLDAETRNAIALAVSEANGCDYCLSAHACSATRFAGTATAEIARNRIGESSDPKRMAAAQFAKTLIESRGHVTDADLDALRQAGFEDARIIEIVALSVQFLFTNFMNNVADTEIDFPAIPDADGHQ